MLPFSEPSAVVTGGPFAFTRNPMYLGLCWPAGLGGCWQPGAVRRRPAFFALIHFRFVLREEPFMAERFGHEYASYLERVRRWL